MSEHLIKLLRNRATNCAKSGANALAELNTYAADEIEQLQASNKKLLEALESVLGWRELRDDNSFPVERVEEICREAITNAKQVTQESNEN